MDSCNQQWSTFDTVSWLRHAQRSALFGFGNRLDAQGEVASGPLSLYSSIFSGVTSITVARSLIPFFLAHRLVTDDVLTECVLDLSGVAPVSRVADALDLPVL